LICQALKKQRKDARKEVERMAEEWEENVIEGKQVDEEEEEEEKEGKGKTRRLNDVLLDMKKVEKRLITENEALEAEIETLKEEMEK
jgi:uncharacterized protein involved in exopolysaccharide biosynthesis